MQKITKKKLVSTKNSPENMQVYAKKVKSKTNTCSMGFSQKQQMNTQKHIMVIKENKFLDIILIISNGILKPNKLTQHFGY